ncbi:MAG: hypothetical protein GY944_26480 [bacterium]|nr:hypothetical protein [bacterium]
MPEPLWSAAVALAREHGVYRISRDLSVTYETLKSRLTKASMAKPERKKGKRRRGTSSPPSAATFVELKAAPVIPPPVASCGNVVIEIDDGNGAKMRIQFDAAAGEHLDVGALVTAFRGDEARGRGSRRR